MPSSPDRTLEAALTASPDRRVPCAWCAHVDDRAELNATANVWMPDRGLRLAACDRHAELAGTVDGWTVTARHTGRRPTAPLTIVTDR